jgi:hypothetical protein
MKKNEVQVGALYTAKVTNRLVQVRIDAVNRYGGWDATNLQTGKSIRIQSPQRLRSAVGDTGAKNGKGHKKATATAEGQGVPTSAPTIEDTANVAADAEVLACEPTAAQAAEDETVAIHTPAKKKAKGAKATDAPKDKRMSGLDAAAKVLEEAGQPMNAKEMLQAAELKGYWKSPGGKTPHATIYSAIIREIAVKGTEARFRKAERGRFVRHEGTGT